MTIQGNVPEWLAEGASFKHDASGTGTVARVGDYKGEATVWIHFDYGERKALSLEYGLPHMGPREPWTRPLRLALSFDGTSADSAHLC